jgi:hypothetical protein
VSLLPAPVIFPPAPLLLLPLPLALFPGVLVSMLPPVVLLFMPPRLLVPAAPVVVSVPIVVEDPSIVVVVVSEDVVLVSLEELQPIKLNATAAQIKNFFMLVFFISINSVLIFQIHCQQTSKLFYNFFAGFCSKLSSVLFSVSLNELFIGDMHSRIM